MKIGLPKNVPRWGGAGRGVRQRKACRPPASWGGACREGPASLEVPVLQVAVLEGEPFLLPLAPLLVVEVDVGALEGWRRRSEPRGLVLREQKAKGPLADGHPGTRAQDEAHLLKLVGDGLGLLVPLEPHHILGVEAPRLLLQGLGCQVLRLGALRGCQWRLSGPRKGCGARGGIGVSNTSR